MRGRGRLSPLKEGGFGKEAPVTNLLLNPYLGSLSTPFRPQRWQLLCSHFAHMWALESAGVMPRLPKFLPPAPAATLAPIPALTTPMLRMLSECASNSYISDLTSASE